MKKALFAIAVFSIFLIFCLPASGQYSLDDRLLSYASFGNRVESVQELLEKGANIEAKDKYGQTPLILAAWAGHTDIVRLLLDKGANIEAVGVPGTALAAAAGMAHPDTVRLLLERGANIEGNSPGGNSPLNSAVRISNIETINLLLDKGANIDARDQLGSPPIITALILKRIDIVRLLLAKGADIEAKDTYGNTALDLALRDGPAEAVDLLEPLHRQRKLQEQAQSKDPREKFAAYLTAFQQTPSDESLREKVIQATAALPEPQAIPDSARQLFVQASQLIKMANSPAALDQPIALLRKALVIAPWWGNAYFNLSRALEMSGQYDDAARQLNYYLKLHPADADASEARVHLTVIQTEKETAGSKHR